MIEETPFYNADFSPGLDVLVLPLSLEQYWGAYWANYAPYYTTANGRD